MITTASEPELVKSNGKPTKKTKFKTKAVKTKVVKGVI